VIDLRGAKPTGIRACIIPCGGVVHPVAASRALLVGDAAGRVSPVTAGGTHTALKHGLAAGNAVADFLHGRAEDPSGWFVRSYPKFRVKRVLRVLFDHFQSDLVFNGCWQLRRCGPRLAGPESFLALGRSIHLLAQFLAVRASPMIPNCCAASTPFFSMNTCARCGIFAACTARPIVSRTQGPDANIISPVSMFDSPQAA
jgi:hypothetical protein